MLMKIKENKGFTLVELMIVVAIIGILAAVAVPMYRNYMQKAKVSSTLIPAVHSMQNSIAAYYATHADVTPPFPSTPAVTATLSDADTVCITSVHYTQAAGSFSLILNARTTCGVKDIIGAYGTTLTATPAYTNQKIREWTLSGRFAQAVGLR